MVENIRYLFKAAARNEVKVGVKRGPVVHFELEGGERLILRMRTSHQASLVQEALLAINKVHEECELIYMDQDYSSVERDS